MIGQALILKLLLHEACEVVFHFGKIEIPLLPCAVSRLERGVVWLWVFSNALRYNLSSSYKAAFFDA